MREIEFRAKHTWDGSFVYGYLGYKANDGKYIINNGKEVNYFVDPETIGQYTGLKDKNGTKIYEGDIAKFKFKGKWVIGQIIYEYCRFAILSKGVGYSITNIFLYKNVDCEIIGNIYDNPELLEG